MRRRAAVVLGAAVVVVTVVAGAYAVTTLFGDGPSATEQVPAGVDAVVRVDMAITEDRVSRRIATAGVESVPVLGMGPGNVSTLVERFEHRTGLDASAAEEVVAFGWRENDSMAVAAAGVIVHGDWAEQAVRDALADDGSRTLTATTYRGQTVYRPASDTGESGTETWLGVLGDGQYVLGTERAVTRTVDVTAGDAGTFDGRLRSTYDATDGGLVTVAARVPTDRVPASAGRAVDLTRYRQVAVVAASYDTTETGVDVQARLRTNSTEAARDVADVTEGGLAIVRGTVGNETVEENLRAIEVEREGKSVVLTYERSVGRIEALVRYYRSLGEDGGDEAGATAAVARPAPPATAPPGGEPL